MILTCCSDQSSMSIRPERAYADPASGCDMSQNSDASKCSLCKIVAIAIAVLLVAGVCLGMAIGYLRTNERGPSVGVAQTKGPG